MLSRVLPLLCKDQYLCHHDSKHWAQAYETGTEITPDKRTLPVPYTANIGRWEVVDHMYADNDEGYPETYRPEDSVFMLGNKSKDAYVGGEPLCLACDQKSSVPAGLSACQARLERGKDMLECERCMGAMHLACESPPLDAPPEVMQLSQKTKLIRNVVTSKLASLSTADVHTQHNAASPDADGSIVASSLSGQVRSHVKTKYAAMICLQADCAHCDDRASTCARGVRMAPVTLTKTCSRPGRGGCQQSGRTC